MIYGIGIDQIEVSRVARKIQDELFLRKIYAPDEIEYCSKRGVPAQHYAARFAAKEAFLKALGTGWEGPLEFSDVAILPDSKGKPTLILSGHVKTYTMQHKITRLHVSLSHLKEIATAMVILEK